MLFVLNQFQLVCIIISLTVGVLIATWQYFSNEKLPDAASIILCVCCSFTFGTLLSTAIMPNDVMIIGAPTK